jgi:hypothetical protein
VSLADRANNKREPKPPSGTDSPPDTSNLKGSSSELAELEPDSSSPKKELTLSGPVSANVARLELGGGMIGQTSVSKSREVDIGEKFPALICEETSERVVLNIGEIGETSSRAARICGAVTGDSSISI